MWGRAAGVLVAVATAAAACSGPPPPVTPDSTITWLASPITQGPNDPRLALIDAFENANPSIKVNLISGPSNTDALRETLRRVIGGGAGVPDVYLGDVIWPATFGHGGLALPLSDHLPPSFWQRFPATLVQGATYRGKVYEAPFFSDQGLLFYRKDLLARAQLPVPTTWEQLAQEAMALQASGLVQDGFVWQGKPYEGLTCVWMELMSDAGGHVLDAAGTRSAIDSPGSLRALGFLSGLVTAGISPRDVTTFSEAEVNQRLEAGDAAFARGWPSTYVDSRSSPFFDDLGVAPLPGFTGGAYPGASTTGGWGFLANPHTAHLAAVLTFIEWMTGTPAQDILATEYHVIAANALVRFDPAIAATSPVLSVASRTAAVLRPASSPAYPAISQAVFANVNSAIAGSLSPEQALRRAGQQIDRALD